MLYSCADGEIFDANSGPIEDYYFGEGCSKDFCEEFLYYQISVIDNQPFISQSSKINIFPYTYQDVNGETYNIKGDSIFNHPNPTSCCSARNKVEVHSFSPVIEWEGNLNENTVVAIFDAIPKYTSNEKTKLSDQNDPIWFWHKGLGDPVENNGRVRLQLNDGWPEREIFRITKNDWQIYTGHKTFFIVIWVWNEDYSKITKSSLLIPFQIKGRQTSNIDSLKTLAGINWKIEDVRDSLRVETLDFSINQLELFCMSEDSSGFYFLQKRDNTYLTGPYTLRNNVVHFEHDSIFEQISVSMQIDSIYCEYAEVKFHTDSGSYTAKLEYFGR